MEPRPNLDRHLDSELFQQYYYLKEELLLFCKENELSTSGSKGDLTKRIAHFLKTGEKISITFNKAKKQMIGTLTRRSVIEPNFVCSQQHRFFFKEQIGKQFTFCVAFQDWLKANAGKTYEEAIFAYEAIMQAQKQETTAIGAQFEYNTYIRASFADNQGKTLQDAIKCWKYKKAKQGHHCYEASDLVAFEK